VSKCRSCRQPFPDGDQRSNGRCQPCNERRYAKARRKAAPYVLSEAHDGSAPPVAVRVITVEQLRANLADAERQLALAATRAERARLEDLAAARRAELAELGRLMTARPRGR
jgi:DNA-directed RNA polymerase subunit RPC12/RpoP